jgi:hypothetical protein
MHLLNMWTALDPATMAADIGGELKTRLRALLAAGVTTVKSVGDSEDDILRVRSMLSAGELVGPRLLRSAAHSRLQTVIPGRPYSARIRG